MRERIEFLRKICGTYYCQTELPDDKIGNFLKMVPIKFENDQIIVNGMKLGKLLNKFGFDNDYISTWMSQVRPQKIEVSCRFKDFYACTDSKHFTSCLSPQGSNRKSLKNMLNDPNWAIALIRDKSGKILCRYWLRYGMISNSETVLVFPPYGNGPSTLAIARSLKGCCWDRYPSLIFQTSPIKYYCDYDDLSSGKMLVRLP